MFPEQKARDYLEAFLKTLESPLTVSSWDSVSRTYREQPLTKQRLFRDITVTCSDTLAHHYRVFEDKEVIPDPID